MRVSEECAVLEAECRRRALQQQRQHADSDDGSSFTVADDGASAAAAAGTIACVVAHQVSVYQYRANCAVQTQGRDLTAITLQATLRCVLAYFLGTDEQCIPHLKIPLHTVFTLAVRFPCAHA